MKPELRERIMQVSAVVSANKKAAADFARLLEHLPPGQVKNLLKDEVCGEILREYGIEGG